jgi:pentatricopeptide repeat protein
VHPAGGHRARRRLSDGRRPPLPLAAAGVIAILLCWGCAEPDRNASLRRRAEAGDRQAQFQLGNALSGERPAEAAKWYREAATREHAGAQAALGDLLVEGRGVAADRNAARLWYEQAVANGADAAINNLAWLLATVPDPEVADAPRAVEMMEDYLRRSTASEPFEWDTLAAAYARAGRFEEAVRVQREAMEWADPPEEDPDGYRERLSSYQRGEPWLAP